VGAKTLAGCSLPATGKELTCFLKLFRMQRMIKEEEKALKFKESESRSKKTS